MSKDLVNKIKVLTILGFIIMIALFVKLLFNEKFTSVESFQLYMKQFGIFAPLILVFFQAFQVVVPVLPGYLGCATGAIAFGPEVGFICNYVGICLGSIISYFLARKYGVDLVLALFPEKQYRKWQKKIGHNKFYTLFLFIATLLPLFPDDFLCYFSGVMRMRRSSFIWTILLGKPWCILAYSIGFGLLK